MKLTGETKLFIGIIISTLIIIGVALTLFSKPESTFTKDELLPATTEVKGNPNAKVYLVEFSDFQCPACKSFKPTVDSIFIKYKDKLVFGYRHFPLSQHLFAQKAAQTAEAAGEQGKFWEMYDYLFTNQSNFSDQFFSEAATNVGLDKSKFDKDIDSEAIKNKITKDISVGQKLGVDSTPTFFLNGKKLTLFSFDDLLKAVDEAVNKN